MKEQRVLEALWQMPATGLSGFEGLIKRLLELMLNETFILARAGDQSSGDAHNAERNVCLQAKRYRGDSLNAKNIEGDFDANLRELPNTDVYVIAVTCNSAQLDDTLTAMRDKSGVDIVVWDFVDADSALPVICLHFWEQLQCFAPIVELNEEFRAYAAALRQVKHHEERFATLERDLKLCTATFLTTHKSALDVLNKRFAPQEGKIPFAFRPIDLGNAVERAQYWKSIKTWWTESKSQVTVLTGAEGTGKSWAAAQCVLPICQDYNSIVLWCDSLNWRTCKSVKEVLTDAVERLKLGDDKKVARLVRKLRTRWSARTLIVLDGVSERGALESAQQILSDLTQKEQGACKILFTTRPLSPALTGYENAFWKRWPHVSVTAFDDAEFEAALKVANIQRREMPPDLEPIARIPRYFQTCIHLRSRLRSFGNISISLVLWTELLDKVNGMESGMRETLGLSAESDAVDVLIKLATNLPSVSGSIESQRLLDSCFGGRYSEARDYLKEIRLFEKAGVFEAKLNPHHTILGWALLIHEILRRLPTSSSVRELADQLQLELEPMADEDGKTEALFVALQLSAVQDPGKEQLRLLHRAALLYSWLFSHNSNATDERLAFWTDYDIDAYASFIEAFYEECYRDNRAQFVVQPLAKLWHRGGESAVTLSSYLGRWLMLVWFEGCSLQGSAFVHNGCTLPIARTHEQIQLATLALSLLSLRPDRGLLKQLALAQATDELTCRDIQNKPYRFKKIYDDMAVLMRWKYTEQVIPELEQMAALGKDNEFLIKGLRWLTRMLRMVDVPQILQLPPRSPSPFNFGPPAVELLRQQQKLFNDESGRTYSCERDFGYLAVRDDLPMMAIEDAQIICKVVETFCADLIVMSGGSRTTRDLDLEAWWPWYAKFQPRKLAELAGHMLLRHLRHGDSRGLFFFLEGVLPLLNDSDMREWEQLAEVISGKIKTKNRRFEDYTGVSIAEFALLLLPEDALHQWFVKAAGNEGRRYSMCFGPLMDLIPLMLPDMTRALAVEKSIANAQDAVRSEGGAITELGYWYYLTGLTAKTNAVLYNWAKQSLLSRDSEDDSDYLLARILLVSAPDGRLEVDIVSDARKALVDKHVMRALAICGKNSFDPKAICGSYRELMRKLPQGFVGGVLALSKRMDDLNDWATELFAIAAGQLSRPPFERRSTGETRITKGPDSSIESLDFERSPFITDKLSELVTNTNESHSGFELLQGKQEQQNVVNEELDRWHLDDDQLRSWENYELYAFGANWALEVWSQNQPVRFLDCARTLLAWVAKDPKAQHHLGGFLHAIICCLLPLVPDEAKKHYRTLLEGSLRLRVNTYYGASEFYDSMWHLERCDSEAHNVLRRQMFEESRNEMDIMLLSMAAMANGADHRLLKIADEFIGAELAHHRALGVSILAWVGSDESTHRLTRILEADRSTWVRHHAEWAREVSLQEKSARGHFRRLIYSDDPILISAGLQVLKPALTPVARWWYHHILQNEKRNGLALSGRGAAVVESFWSHWLSTRNSSVEVCRRKLEDYCRGERIDRLAIPLFCELDSGFAHR